MKLKFAAFLAFLLAAIVFIGAAPGIQQKLTPVLKNKALPAGWSTPIDLSEIPVLEL